MSDIMPDLPFSVPTLSADEVGAVRNEFLLGSVDTFSDLADCLATIFEDALSRGLLPPDKGVPLYRVLNQARDAAFVNRLVNAGIAGDVTQLRSLIPDPKLQAQIGKLMGAIAFLKA